MLKTKKGRSERLRESQDGQVALNFKQLTKHSYGGPSALPPCYSRAFVADSFAREAADRELSEIGFHCHTVPQNSCPTLRQSGAARTYTYRANKVVRILAQEGNINPSHLHLSWLRNHVLSHTKKKKKTRKLLKKRINKN